MWTESVTENYTSSCLVQQVKVKTRCKRPRYLRAIGEMDKPCELQCHVYSDLRYEGSLARASQKGWAA